MHVYWFVCMKPYTRQIIGLLCRKNYLCKHVAYYTRHSRESHPQHQKSSERLCLYVSRENHPQHQKSSEKLCLYVSRESHPQHQKNSEKLCLYVSREATPSIRKTENECVCMFRFVCHSADFYEEMLALLDMFTTVSVSPQMWQMMGIIYDSFSRDGFDYFTGMYILTGDTIQKPMHACNAGLVYMCIHASLFLV